MSHFSYKRPKSRRDAVEVILPQDRTVEFEGPKGPLKARVDSSYFSTSYRGDVVQAATLETLTRMLRDFEETYQQQQAVAKSRKAQRLEPQPGLFWMARGLKYTLEEIQVRGKDARSGEALITRADGVKETRPWSHILRPLNDEERSDLLTAMNNAVKAGEAAKAVEAPAADRVLADMAESEGPFQVEAAISPDGIFFIEIDGSTLTAPSVRELRGKVEVYLLMRAGYAFTAPRMIALSDEGLLPLTAERDDYLGSVSLYRTKEEYDADLAAKEAHDAATQTVMATVRDYLFDPSLVS